MTWKKTSVLASPAMTTSVLVVAAVLVAVACTSVTGVSAITSKSGPSVIKTTLQIFPPESVETTTNDRQEQPSFAARYWQKQRAVSTGPSDVSLYGSAGVDEINESILQPPHKLSAAQQAHILEDVRRHNQHQQWWTASGSAGSADTTLPPSPSVTVRADKGNDYSGDQPEVTDQLQQLLQINGVAAVDDDVLDSQDEDRQSKQRSIGIGGGAAGWQPQTQPSQVYNRQPLSSSISPYIPAQPTASQPQHYNHHQQNQHHQQKYNPTVSSVGPVTQQPFFVTPPSSAIPINHNDDQHHQNQQQPFIPFSQQQPNTHKQQYYSQNPAIPSSSSGGDDDGLQGLHLDADIEQQIRQKLTAVTGGGNYTILAPPGKHRTQQQQISGLASSDNIQYVQIGGGSGSGPSSSRNRIQQQFETTSTTMQPSANKGNRNTIVKTVVVRQKPSPQPTTTPPTTVSSVPSLQQQWTNSEQQQLEQLARQVLPPGVAQYEIIRAGAEVDGAGAKSNSDATAVVSSADTLSASTQQSQSGGKKKPVTFVILEERPDGTVRVRGIEKKQHGTNMGTQSDSGGVPDSSLTGANDEQLQQLVDKLNRGELRLPGSSPTSKNGGSSSGTDSAVAASTTAAAPLPAFVPSFPSTVPTPPLTTGNNVHRFRDPSPSPSPYFPPVTPQTTTTDAIQHNNQYQNFFLPTAVPTAAVTVSPATGMIEHLQQNWHQQQYYSPPAIATAASSTPSPSNTTLSYHKNKVSKDGTFSGALRRRGYYAMAKYMRQAGIDSVLEDTGPFTLFVPTDKAFRALLVQLGGPDRAEEKFHENPRLLIGLLLHHVVPGAFKAADLKAGDEMTGVSLAGTQLRANLYARQLYDNRWNDIEVLTVNGARVLDDVIPAALDSADDVSPNDFLNNESVQQRRDMILAPNGVGAKSRTGENQQIMAIAHAIDRVLFPLPVGDVLATMRADRQRRYSVFLRAVDEYCSASVRALLSGSRTVTVFAPVDEAFRARRGSGNHNVSTGSILDGVIREDANGRYKKRNQRRIIADRFVLSHVVLAGPGDPPMYTAGLRFYQVRDTAYRLSGVGTAGDDSSFAEDYNEAPSSEDGHGVGNDGNLTLPTAADNDKPRYYQLTIYKDSGRIRLNGGAAQVTVRNVPATNGVLHGIDAPLV